MNEQRLLDVLHLYQQATGLKGLPSTVRANGTSLEKIAFARDGGFERFVNWANGKIRQKREESRRPAAEDAEELKAIFNEAYTLIQERSAKYGDSWRTLTIPALAGLCISKLSRLAYLQVGDPKARDEFMDTLNYCAMGIISLRELEEKIKEDERKQEVLDFND